MIVISYLIYKDVCAFLVSTRKNKPLPYLKLTGQAKICIKSLIHSIRVANPL